MKSVETVRPLAVSMAVAAILVIAAACGGSGDGGQALRSLTASDNQGQVPRSAESRSADTTPVPATAEQESQPSAAAGTAQEGDRASPIFGQIGGEIGDDAPEFEDIASWINSGSLAMQQLRGKVVLIDFWTYTCVNCIRTFPYLKDWYAKYAGKGLVIVGVHSPEFEFEKITENVARSSRDFGLEYPIAQDNDFATWRAYSNRFWPAKYLVDKDGVVRYTHFGEGAYDDTEAQIRGLLEEAGADLSGVVASSETERLNDPRAFNRDPATRLTREIYAGFDRNAAPQGIYVAHVEYYDAPEQSLFYTDPGDHLNQFVYLQGSWFNGLEELRHARETEGYEDYIALKFFATSVNAVIDPKGEDPFDVQVTIDGRPLLPEEAGADVVVYEGRSFFRVDEGRLYEVVALPEFTGHELKLSANSKDFSLFAFTFGAYAGGP
jgi:thiol-disulfide isomerase/thioredoxin